MRKKLITTSALLLSVAVGYAQFNFLGSGTTINGGKCLELTSNTYNQSGWAYSSEKFSLATRDTLEFDIFLGNSDAGADGMVFILHNDPRGFAAEGCVGESMGYGLHPSGSNSAPCGYGSRSAITPSMAIEFDTYQNGNQGDPRWDHIAYLENGNTAHGSGYQAVWNMENNNTHTFRFIWDPTLNLIQVYYDNYLVVSRTRDLVNDIFGGTDEVYWGFSASTGGATNQHYFCPVTDDDDAIISLAKNFTVQSGAFSDASTWIGGNVPGSGDCAVISTGHTVTATSDVTVGGLQISLGAKLDGGSQEITLDKCDLIKFGNLDADDAKINFTATNSQLLSLLTEDTIRDIKIQNSVGVTNIGSRLNVTGTLDLGSTGNFNTGNNLRFVSTADETGRLAELSGSAQITGNITMQRHIYTNRRIWRYLSSPVTNTFVLDWQLETPISGKFPLPDSNFIGETGVQIDSDVASLFYYDETRSGNAMKGYVKYPRNLASVLSPLENGRGYSLFIRDNSGRPKAIDVTGTPRTGTVNLPVSYTNSGLASDDGWNLVGNPYPSQIDWDAIASGRKVNIDNAIYFLDNDNATPVSRSYVNGIGNPFDTDGIIASSQAFWVKANAASPVLQIQESDKTGASHSFYRNGEVANLLRMRLESSDGIADEAVVRLENRATKAFDNTYDAHQHPHEHLKIATLITTGEELSINTLPEDIDTVHVAMSNVPAVGAKLSFSGLDSYNLDYDLVCIDLNSGKVYDLNEEIEVDGSERFALVIRKNEDSFSKVIAESKNASLLVYPNPCSEELLHVHISNATAVQRLELVSVHGQKATIIPLEDVSGSGVDIDGDLNVADLTTGVYMLIVYTATEKLTATVTIH